MRPGAESQIMNIVVTGMGAVSPIGNSASEIFEGLKQGKNGIARIERIETENLPVKFAGEVKDFDPVAALGDAKKARQTARYIQFGYAAAKEAIEQAQISAIPKDRVGVILGSGMGGIEVFEDNVIRYHEKGARRVNPFFIPMSITNLLAGWVAIEYGFEGPNFSISTACATANHCFLEGASMIERGLCDVVIAGGSEAAINNSGISGFSAMKALSTQNEDPATASRPFDRDRNGFVLGEGAGVLILESEEHARKRGASVLARLAGGGMNCDAHHITSPHPEGRGAAQAMKMALAASHLNPNQIDWINAHGTSTEQGDLAESQAISSVFGSLTPSIPVSSTKSILGHCLGAAGGIEAIAAILALQEGFIHANFNLKEKDADIPLNVLASPLEKKCQAVLSNSFGFGGHNCSVIFMAG